MIKNVAQRMIKKGKENTIIERLEEYILPVYPEWKKKRRPACEETITKWNIRCGNLPETYLQYLNYMGEGDGEFLSERLHADTRLSEIISWYEEEEINPKEVLFAVSEIGVEWYIVTKENEKQPIDTNFRNDYEEEEYAESFEKLLCQQAYWKYEPKYCRYRNYIPRDEKKSREKLRRLEEDGKDFFEELEKYSKKYGFEKAWYSDRSHYIGIKQDMSFYITKRIKLDMEGDIYGINRKEVEKMRKKFEEFLAE